MTNQEKKNMDHIEKSHEYLVQNEDKKMDLVLIESPLASPTIEGLIRNKKYARECMRDCLERGEAPYASHLIYVQEGLLDDDIATERALGIHAGLLWGQATTKTIVYTDLGISSGMKMGIERAQKEGKEIIYRSLGFIPEVSSTEIHLEKMKIQVHKDVVEERRKREAQKDNEFNQKIIEEFLETTFTKISEEHKNFEGKHNFKSKITYAFGNKEVVLWRGHNKFYVLGKDINNDQRMKKLFFDNNGDIECYSTDGLKELFLYPYLKKNIKQSNMAVPLKKI